MVRHLAKKEHPSTLAQLASRTSAIVTFGVGAGVDPFVKVNSLFADLISKLQAETSSEASHKIYCDEERSPRFRGRCWEAVFQTRSDRGQIHRSRRRSTRLRPSSTSLVTPFQSANDYATLFELSHNAPSQPAKVATVEFEVLGTMCGSSVGVDRAARNVDWPSVVDARINLPIILAQVNVVEPTPPATLALKESIEDFGLKITARTAPSNRLVTQWTVRLRILGE